MKKILILLVLFLIAMLVSGASAADAVKIGTSFESPAAGDGLIAWAATSGSCIKVLNVDTGEKIQIPVASPVSHVTAGGKWIAWYEDSRHILSIYNMNTQKVKSVSNIDISGTPVISGDKIAYSVAGNIFKYDLLATGPDLIAEGNDPSIFGDALVYEKDGQIIVSNNSINQVLTRSGSLFIKPCTNGKDVAFSDGANLSVYNIGTGATTAVATKVYDYAISGDEIVYSRIGDGVYTYNLSSGISFMVNNTQKNTQDPETAAQVTASKDGNIIAWRYVNNVGEIGKAAGIFMDVIQATDPTYTYINV